MGVTRAGLDRALVAHTLWERCAIPAILYAVDALLVTVQKSFSRNIPQISTDFCYGTIFLVYVSLKEP